MNDIKKALDSTMKNFNFDKSLVLGNNKKYERVSIAMKRIIVAISAITMVSLFMTGIGQMVFKKLYIPMTGQEQPEVLYEIDENLFSELQQEAIVYKFKNDKNHKQEVGLLLESIGLIGEPEYDSKSKTYHKRKDNLSFIYEEETGNWSFRDEKAYDIGERNNIPDDYKAIEIAKNVLNEKYHIYNERFSKIIVVEQTSGDEISKNLEVLFKDVFFYPTINDMPIYGISRIIVSIGHEGEIVGISKYYKEYEEYKKVKLKNPRKAFEEVKNGKASNNIDPNAKKAKIKRVQLGYWEDGGSIKEQPHLQPVWIFEGESIDDNNEISNFDVIVPAIE